MQQAKKVVALALLSAGLALVGAGCQSDGDAPASQSSGSDHPQSDHPQSDHPKSDHPK